MAEGLARLKYDAWTPGETEMYYGIANLLKFAEAMKCDAVSANVMDGNGKPIFKDHVIKTVGGIRIGITGVTSKTIFESVPVAGNLGAKDYQFLDPIESLKPIVNAMQNETDMVLVLAHVGAGDARRLAEEVPGIDAIVAGHRPGYMPSPDRVGDVVIMRAGDRGQYGAKLNLTFDASKAMVDYKGTADALNESYPADATIGNDVQKFLDGLAKSEAEQNRKNQINAANNGKDKFLGTEICARCHSDIYTTWSKGPHASAFQTLVAANKQTDRSCIGCHVTGWGDPTGYQTLVYRTDSAGKPDTTDAVEFRNVQCESCHGKGTMHGTAGLTAKVGEEACVTCHDKANDPDFDFKKAIAQGLHHH
ncbi:MAG TPA: multiheme c-type cytochrome [Candidatus Eisenbacteria bacterium]